MHTRMDDVLGMKYGSTGLICLLTKCISRILEGMNSIVAIRDVG